MHIHMHHPHEKKPNTFIVFDAHMLIVGVFGSGQGSVGAIWLVWGYPAPYTAGCYALFSDTFLCPFWYCSLGLLLPFLVQFLVDTKHCILGRPFKTCCFRDTLTQLSSHHNLVLVKVVQICRPVHFPASNTQNFKNWFCLLLVPNISHHLTGATVTR